jgi:hypothetical protein
MGLSTCVGKATVLTMFNGCFGIDKLKQLVILFENHMVITFPLSGDRKRLYFFYCGLLRAACRQ